MIYAAIIVCSFVGKPDCILLSDTRGPYRAIEHCLSRTGIMYNDALTVLLDYVLVESKCLPEKGERHGTKRFPKSTSSV